MLNLTKFHFICLLRSTSEAAQSNTFSFKVTKPYDWTNRKFSRWLQFCCCSSNFFFVLVFSFFSYLLGCLCKVNEGEKRATKLKEEWSAPNKKNKTNDDNNKKKERQINWAQVTLYSDCCVETTTFKTKHTIQTICVCVWCSMSLSIVCMDERYIVYIYVYNFLLLLALFVQRPNQTINYTERRTTHKRRVQAHSQPTTKNKMRKKKFCLRNIISTNWR